MNNEIIYFYNEEDDEYYRSRYTHKYLESLQQENQQLKKALNEIREYINKNTDSNPIENLTYKLFIYKKEEYEFIEDILEIIEKGLGDEK